MKVVTSITTFNDAVGKRMSVSYSEIDDNSGQIVSDNKRIDRVITDQTQKNAISAVEAIAQAFVDAL